MDIAIMIGSLVIAAGLGFIPASIAKNKGYSFGLWWFYGWMLFIVALIHSLVLTDKKSIQMMGNYASDMSQLRPSNADEIKKYKDLRDMGVISQEEFDIKKNQLLGFSGNVNSYLNNTTNVSSSPKNYICPNCKSTINQGEATCRVCGTAFNW
jgi:uncharacterized membrane protein